MDSPCYELRRDGTRPLGACRGRPARAMKALAAAIRWAIAIVLRGWLKFYHRFTIVGRENLPAGGPFVLIANHASHLDTLCLLAALPLRQLHRAYPAAAADHFFVSVPRAALAVLVVNALPFNRRSHIRRSLRLCRALLLAEQGNVLILYPEGTRSTNGVIGPFKRGVGSLLAGAKTQAVPCYLQGAGGAWPKGRWIPRPRRIRLIIGTPRSYPAAPVDRAGALAVCRDLRQAVMGLSYAAATACAPGSGARIPMPSCGATGATR